MWTLLITAMALAQTPVQQFDAALGWHGDTLVWRSHTQGWFAPPEAHWVADTGGDPCAHVYEALPDPEITCSEVHVTGVSGSLGFTVAVTAFDTEPEFCGEVDWQGLIGALPGKLAPGRDGVDGPDGVQITLARVPEEEAPVPQAVRGEDGWTVTRDEGGEETVRVEVRRGGVAFSFQRDWPAGVPQPEPGFTTLYPHWSPDGRHVALLWTEGSGDGFGERFRYVSAEVYAVRPLIQILAHPDLGPNAADGAAASVLDRGPVATGAAKKARQTTVVYASEAFLPDAKGLAPGLSETATVEPLTWESPADVVIALGTDIR